MLETRRDFFANAALLSACLAFSREILRAQNPPTPPPKPEPGYKPNPAEIHSNSAEAVAAARARLLENEKEFRDGVDQFAAGLRDELQKTPTTDVFSIHILKETEEIEKLAKRLKSQAKSA